MEDASRGVQSCTAALEELERRDADEAERARVAAESDARREAYEWIAEYARRLIALQEAREALRLAEDHATALSAPRLIARRWTGFASPLESALDSEVHCLPEPQARGRYETYLDLAANLTVDELRATEQRALARAQEERDGNGRDFSGQAEERLREKLDARAASKAAQKAAEAEKWAERRRKMEEKEAKIAAGTLHRRAQFSPHPLLD
jgi:hypothetical protein